MNKLFGLFLIHIPAWFILCCLSIIIVGNSYTFIHSIEPPALLFIGLICLLPCFYAFYIYLVPRYLEQGKQRLFVTYTLLSVFVFFPACLYLNGLIFYYISVGGMPTLMGSDHIDSLSLTTSDLKRVYFGGIIGALISGGLGTFYRFGRDWFRDLQIKKDLENQNLLSELKNLKAKLNPHVLFNTLNNIDALITTNPKQASTALAQLSDILRYVVYETEAESVPLQKEIENLEQFIALEKIRIINPHVVKFTHQVSEETSIPPMLFFPFVENGFKHSNLNQLNQYLDIAIVEEDHTIKFSCVNTINKTKPSASTPGVGLELAKKRLALLFPHSHQLKINSTDQAFRVSLEITKEKR